MTDKDRDLVDEALHPRGRCECAGEGTCSRCLEAERRELQEKVEADIRETLLSFVGKQPDHYEVQKRINDVFRSHIPKPSRTDLDVRVDHPRWSVDGKLKWTFTLPDWLAEVFLEDGPPVYKVEISEAEIESILVVKLGKAGPVDEPVKLETFDEAREVFGSPSSDDKSGLGESRLGKEETDSVPRPSSIDELVSYVAKRIEEDETETAPSHWRTRPAPSPFRSSKCLECGDPVEVIHYYTGQDESLEVGFYCSDCATGLDGVDWPPTTKDAEKED